MMSITNHTFLIRNQAILIRETVPVGQAILYMNVPSQILGFLGQLWYLAVWGSVHLCVDLATGTKKGQ